MCECFRGIFRVTWTPPSSAGSDGELEESYVFFHERESTAGEVRSKERAAPSQRPPTAAPPAHPLLSAEEPETPERVVQKEKLHAELKQVLSLKRSFLKETSHPSLQSMDPPVQINVTQEEVARSELVEVVVETEAEAGASGFSVAGGGEQGIFVKNVLKDSPAAKSLSLQKGDQLLSARVYFDNVKYEDALKILQCAEPYKVSFFLKRTVPSSDVNVSPGSVSLDVKGPKAKMPKMRVKSVKPLKTKKRMGRFSLRKSKKGKLPAGAELKMEGSPAKLELSPVDVEFAFPKFSRLRKGGKASAEGGMKFMGSGAPGGVAITGRKKKRIKFPRMKVKDSAGARGDVSIETQKPEGELAITLPEGKADFGGPEAKLKAKGKSPKFGISFPKTKKAKVEVSPPEGTVDVKPPEARFKHPSVEFDFGLPLGKKEVSLPEQEITEKEGHKFKPPKVELGIALPSGKADITVPQPEVHVKGPKVDIKGGPEREEGTLKAEGFKIKMPKVGISTKTEGVDVPSAKGELGIEGPEGKLKTPKIKLPQIELSMPSGEFEGAGAELSIEAPEGKHKGGLKMPSIDIAAPKVDIDFGLSKGKGEGEGELSAEGTVDEGMKVKMPKVTLPKFGVFKGDMEAQVSPPKVEGEIKGPKAEVEVVDIDAKGPKMKMPSVGISLPKIKVEGAGPEGGMRVAEEGGEGKMKLPGIKMPSIDLSVPIPDVDLHLPKGKGAAEVEMKGDLDAGSRGSREGLDIKLKMPKISLPKFGASGKLTEPDADVHISGPKVDVKGPGADVKIRDIEVEGPDVKGARISMPKVDISLPKIKVPDAELDVHGMETEGLSSKGPKISMPSVDISLPKMKLPEVDLKTQGIEIGGPKTGMPKVDISLPKMKSPEADIKVEGPGAKGAKISIPTVDVSLPKMKLPKADIEVEGPGAKGAKIGMPKVDISLPKMKLPEADIEVEGPGAKGAKIGMPKVDISLPKMKLPEADIEVEGPGAKGAKIGMPKVDISLPKMKLPEADFEVEGPGAKGAKIGMPKVDISLPKMKLPEADIEVEGPGAKGAKIGMPKVDISLPKMKLPEADFEVEGPGAKGAKIGMPKVDISLPKMKFPEADIEVEGPGAKGAKIGMPKVDISLPKMKFPEADIDVKGPGAKGAKIGMPKVDISLPKMKFPEADIDVEGPGAKGAKIGMPKVDISLPKMKLPEADFEVEGPGAKGAKIGMPKVDISLPKMKLPEADFEVEGPGAKGAKIGMPKVDISLPKMKLPEADIEVEGPGAKGAKIGMPKVDISLPKMKFPEADIDVEGPGAKGAKIGMPKVDISLPKMKLPEAELDIKGKEMEGPDRKGLKMGMPKFDISLPKIKSKEMEYDVQGMEIEGPSVKGPKISVPKVDISLPKVDVQGPEMEGSKISAPKVDISLPKIKIPEGEVPSVKMPSVDIDMPKIDLDLSLPKVRGKDTTLEHGISAPEPSGGFDMPDVHLKMPKIPMPKFGVKGKEGEMGADLELKGDIKTPKGKIDVSHPEIEASTKLPKGKLDIKGPEFESVGTDAKLKLPTVKVPKLDISAPKLPDIDLNIKMPKGAAEGTGGVEIGQGPEVSARGPNVEIKMPKIPTFGKGKGEAEVKAPELDIEAPDLHFKGPNIKMPKIGISFPKGKPGEDGIEGEAGISPPTVKTDTITPEAKVKVPKIKLKTKGTDVDIDTSDASLKLPTVNLPTVDISAPKIDLDFGLSRAKAEDKEQIELLKAEGDRPSSGASFDVPDVSLKMPKFSLPKIGGKSKHGDLELEGRGSKTEIRVTPPKIAIEGRAPSEESDADGKLKGKMKMPKIKMPSFGMSWKEGEVGISGPEVESKVKKGKVDITGPEIDIEGPGGKGKMPKLKLPKFKISSPKGKLPEGEAEVKLRDEVSGKGGVQAPDVTIKMPKFSMPKFGSKEGNLDVSPPDADMEAKGRIKMPSLEISLPAAKQREGEVLLPKAEVDVTEEDIKGYGGHLKIPKMPTLDISAPKIELDVGLPKAKANASLDSDPGLKAEGDGNFEGTDFKLKMPKVSLPSFGISGSKENDIDVSGSKPDVGASQRVNIKGPKAELSKPKISAVAPDVDIEGDEGKLKMPKIKMPKVDISVPKGKLGDVDMSLGEGGVDKLNIEGDTGEGKFKMPSFGMPKFTSPTVKAPDLDLELSVGKHKHETEITGPEVDVKGKKIEVYGPVIDTESSEFKIKMPKIKMPKIGISGPYLEGADLELDTGVPKADKGKGKIKTEAPKGNKDIKKTETEEEGAEGKFKIKMPKFGIKGTTEHPDLEADAAGEGGDAKFKMPKISLPGVGFSVGKEGGVDALDIPEAEGSSKTGKFKMPDVEISGPKIKGHMDTDTTGANADLSTPEDKERIKLQMPKITLPSVGFSDTKDKSASTELIAPEADVEGKIKGPKFEIKAPKIEIKVPDLDIRAPEVQGKGPLLESEDLETDKDRKAKAKKAKFGIALPSISQPETAVKMSTPGAKEKGPDVKLKAGTKPSESTDTDGDYEGPKMPKVKKAVFVFAKPKTNGSDASEGESSSTEAKMKVPKIKMKPSFGKSHPKGKKGDEVNVEGEDEEEEEGKSKGGKLKMPKVTFSPGKTGSFDVTLNGSGSAGSKKGERSGSQVNGESDLTFQNGSQEAKFGKMKLPKVEFSSPYSKGMSGEGDAEMSMKLVKSEDSSGMEGDGKGAKYKSPKITFPGFKRKPGKEDGEEKAGALVSSKARTEMVLLEPDQREASESPKPKVSIGFVSGRGRGDPKSAVATGSDPALKMGAEGNVDSKDKSPRFKIPKFSISPRSTGILRITEGGSPQGSRDSLQRSEEEERSSRFKIQMPRIGFSTQHASEEPVVTTKEGNVVVVTKTSKHTSTESGTEKSTTI
ncbi:neuroblast differentiation-associated protein AHNAK [Lepisosteus oculatus]|uniref:neuroblast differentiation-associated protein AHNAK n=1 Tax=Lepisosteus oculatus TaxID=7918 RepID=UPI003711BB3D